MDYERGPCDSSNASNIKARLYIVRDYLATFYVNMYSKRW